MTSGRCCLETSAYLGDKFSHIYVEEEQNFIFKAIYKKSKISQSEIVVFQR